MAKKGSNPPPPASTRQIGNSVNRGANVNPTPPANARPAPPPAPPPAPARDN